MAFEHRDTARQKRRMLPYLAIGLVVAFFAYMQTATNYYGRVAPRIAPAFLQSDPKIALRRQQFVLAEEGAEGFDVDQAYVESVQLLRKEPLNAMAIRFLKPRSMIGSAGGEEMAALLLAERVTRRDTLGQLSLVLSKGAAEDAEGAIANIDRLFTVNPELVDPVTPQFLPVVEADSGRDIMAQKAARPWFVPFLRAANRETENPAALADFILMLEEAPAEFDKANPGRLAAKLVRAAEYDKALAIAEFSGIEPESFDQFEPTDENTQPEFEPLSWRLADNEDGFATLLGEGRVSFDLEAGRRLSAMERITRLLPGDFNFEISLSDNAGAGMAWEWRLFCRSGTEDWSRQWSSGLQLPAEQLNAFPLTIPADGSCEYQRWNLVLQSDSGQRGSSAEMLLRLFRD